MILKKFSKQPAEYKDYDVDYSAWLVFDAQDSLDDVQINVECLSDPADDTMIVDRVQITSDIAKLWVRGGTHDHRYKVTILATTTVGRKDESELIFTVKDI